MDEEMEITLCGVVVGTASGWDQQDPFVFTFYDPKLKPEFEVADAAGATYLNVDFESGLAEFLDDAGDTLATRELLKWLRR